MKLSLPWFVLVVVQLLIGCDSAPEVPEESSAFEVRWTYSYTSAGVPRPVPVIVDKTVIGTAGTDLVRVDIETGEEVWREPATQEWALAAVGIATDGHHLLVAHRDEFRGFRVSDGAMVWRQSFDDNIAYGYPNTYSRFSYGNGLFYTPSTGRIFALDAQDFSPHFRSPPLPGKSYWVTPNSNYVVTGGRGEPLCDDCGYQSYISALDAQTGDSLWTRDAGVGDFDAPGVIQDGVVYASNKVSDFAIEIETNTIVWERKYDASRGMIATAKTGLVLGDGKMFGYYGFDAYARDAATGELLWVSDISGTGSEEIVYHEGHLYIVHGALIYILDTDTGKIVHRESAPSGYWWNITKGGGQIIAQSTSDIVAFEPYR